MAGTTVLTKALLTTPVLPLGAGLRSRDRRLTLLSIAGDRPTWHISSAISGLKQQIASDKLHNVFDWGKGHLSVM